MSIVQTQDPVARAADMHLRLSNRISRRSEIESLAFRLYREALATSDLFGHDVRADQLAKEAFREARRRLTAPWKES